MRIIVPEYQNKEGKASDTSRVSFAKMATMKKRLLLTLTIAMLTLSVTAQGSSGELLARINNLRASVGQSGYTINSALTVAATNHAAWMARTGKVSHTQDDGTGPRARAQSAGYSSNFVSENIYMGSDPTIETAWSFWLNSPVHYAGMTSPNYNNIGIGTASGANGFAYVLVFGNSTGSLPRSVTTGISSGGGGSNSAPEPPSYVVGVDAIGNIMHEVQPGDTIGDIALIYGYTWEVVPYMLDVNGLTEADVAYLEIGSVFLVPPQDGTYTPTPAKATQTPTPTKKPTQKATATPTAIQLVAPATFVMPSPTPTEALIVRSVPTQTPTTSPVISTSVSEQSDPSPIQSLLIVAIVIQVGVIGVATIEFLRRSH